MYLYRLRQLPKNNQRNAFLFADISLRCNQPSFFCQAHHRPLYRVRCSIHFDFTKEFYFFIVHQKENIFSIFWVLQVKNDKIVKTWETVKENEFIDWNCKFCN